MEKNEIGRRVLRSAIDYLLFMLAFVFVGIIHQSRDKNKDALPVNEKLYNSISTVVNNKITRQ